MDYVIVLGAAAAGFVFSAVWYTIFGKAWQAEVGLSDDDVKPAKAKGAYAVAIIAAIVVSGVLRHVFVGAGLYGAGAGLIGGLGVGLFIAGAYIGLNYAFAQRSLKLAMIDIGNAGGSCGAIGLVLGLLL
ncbi:MAG: DUF1761 domain-containing protein [Pikeienuella sp.]